MKKHIALTFDDGPNTDTTPRVLEKLKKYGIPAAFFLVGDNITPESAEVSRAAFGHGCELCSHSRTHTAMTELTAEEIRAETEFTDSKIKEITGTASRFFRPPYIAVNNVMLDTIDKIFIAGIGAEDWLDEVTAEMRAEKILAQAKNGSIILLHDMRGNSRTVSALDLIIPALLNDGYEFLTVSELFTAEGVAPKRGIIYSNVLQTEIY